MQLSVPCCFCMLYSANVSYLLQQFSAQCVCCEFDCVCCLFPVLCVCARWGGPVSDWSDGSDHQRHKGGHHGAQCDGLQTAGVCVRLKLTSFYYQQSLQFVFSFHAVFLPVIELCSTACMGFGLNYTHVFKVSIDEKATFKKALLLTT